MAGLAVNRCVRADQWESILVSANRLNGNIPTVDGMAGIAIRPELAAVDIRVTVRAFLAHVGEH